MIRVIHDTGGASPDRWAKNVDVTDRPCPAITNGINGMNACHFKVEITDDLLCQQQPERLRDRETLQYQSAMRDDDGGRNGRRLLQSLASDLRTEPNRTEPNRTEPNMKHVANKPPYRVPLMEEIRAIPWNGFTVASTFSGAGGSCVGYRMAGFKVVWSNEFVPIAQKTYKANCEPDCFLDCRDIHQVTAERILIQTGLKVGELDILDGSPPCQAFSTAGKRSEGWGKKKRYEHGAMQCNETLFGEYIRLLRGLMPKVFIAENVSGLVKGVAKGYFLKILAALKASGYRVKCKVLDAKWLGVPQSRQRTIFVGVREDLGVDPVHPKPLPYWYSVRDALPWITAATTSQHGFTKGDELAPDKIAPAVPASASASAYTGHRVIGAAPHTLPPSILKEGAYGVQQVDPEKPCPTVTIGSPGNDLAVPLAASARIVHPSGRGKGHDDSVDDPMPTIMARPEGVGGMGPGQTLLEIEGANGFNNHVSGSIEKPMQTVQAGRPVADSNGPARRKFTIDEVKAICSFPHDFILLGSYAQQWERLGNSVPPVMMMHIASVVRDQILNLCTSRKVKKKTARCRK